MTRFALLASLLLVLAACPGDDRELTQDSGLVVDTMPSDTAVDLSQIKADIPPPDTATRVAAAEPREPSAPAIPAAPEPLVAAVRREASSSQFCFTEHGQKRDPNLRGSVTMIVTVGSQGVTNARIGASRWIGSQEAGRAVTRCLVDRAERTWTLAPGAVQPGQYRVPMTFSGS